MKSIQCAGCGAEKPADAVWLKGDTVHLGDAVNYGTRVARLGDVQPESYVCSMECGKRVTLRRIALRESREHLCQTIIARSVMPRDKTVNMMLAEAIDAFALRAGEVVAAERSVS